MTSEIPNVLVLKPITPSVESVAAERLEYTNLLPAVEKHRKYESARIDKFWSAEQDSLEEIESARQLAMQYLLMGSLALNQTYHFSDSAKVWSDRFTEASGELYGFPEPELAKSLWHERERGEASSESEFKDAADKLGDFLNDKYQSVYDALNLESSTEMIDAATIADKFEAGLLVLAEQHDPSWGEWAIERDPTKDSLSVNAMNQKIIVGMRRVHEDPIKVKALFSHEVLIHGLRGLNGGKNSKQLKGGLPGYIDAEEGLGVFAEYSITGEINQKSIDRYIDIAYALGQIDGHTHTRSELFDIVLDRATTRNEQKDNKKTPDVLKSEAQTYVNRIYRGTQGNDNVGVFTKDISYHKGFVMMGRYITEKIAEGKEIDEIMEFLTIGKFDPTNAQHVSYVESVTKSE